MNVSPLGLAAAALPAAVPAQRVPVSSGQLLTACRLAWEQDGRLVALWASDERDRKRGFCIRVVLEDRDGLTLLEHPLPHADSHYPDLSPIFPAANRMQRAAFDLVGIASDADDQRPWAWMASWPIHQFPLRRDFVALAKWAPGLEDYAFVRVEGDGVHEIPVGPVHAGIIEPGHFRFQVVGEKVLRLEERLGYVHKGIEKRFESMSLAEGHRLAGRVSGDSTVAYAWAYAMALESAAGHAVPPRAQALRALLLERERVANHLGDLGALGNDAALAFALAQFSRLREDWQRLSAEVFGHRLLMDTIVPGGVAGDLVSAHAERLWRQCDAIEADLLRLRAIFGEHAGLQDRFMGTGEVRAELIERLGGTGMAARASGVARDLRCDYAWPPYDDLGVNMAVETRGDVAARVNLRFAEVLESLRLIRALAAGLPAGPVGSRVELPAAASAGAGWVEGWRGEVFVALELDDAAHGHAILRCHCHDPSWQNWPLLEHAVIGNIVPDFPLINKSFNLSYSGQDL